MRTLRMGGFSPGQVKLLSAGRVLDTTRLRERAGYTPRFTTIEAFDDFAADAAAGAAARNGAAGRGADRRRARRPAAARRSGHGQAVAAGWAVRPG